MNLVRCFCGFRTRGWAACVLLGAASCHGPAATVDGPRGPATQPHRPVQRDTAVEATVVPGVAGAEEDRNDRWLFVRAPVDRAAGGWATGSFDRPRNRLTIRTHDVRRFVVDTTRIRIDWDRLVVLSIDGRTSELRRRDDPVLDFELDNHGEWVIREP